jgi:murein DD-endopeptidase MepM/ murein hydrolase activator NlpD
MTGFNAVGASFETRRRAALGPLQVPSSLLLILRSPRSGRLEGRRIFVQRRRPVLRLLALLLLAHPAFAGSLRLDGPIEQGGLVRGKAEPGAKVALDGQPVRIAPDGGFVIGFGRDAAPKAVLDLVYADGTRERRELAVAVRQYEVQRIDGLPAEQVTPDAAAEARIKREAVIIAKARAVDSDLLAFEQPFAWPAVGPISGVFGSQRILNSEARAPHAGVDIAAPRGAAVAAAGAGTVTLAEPDLFFTGGTVIIDHGYGLATTYQHMDTVEVTVGRAVAAGERIGTVGATGRVTGPHLHWSLNWYAVRLDPALAVGPMPAAER